MFTVFGASGDPLAMSSPRGPRTRSRMMHHKENNPAEAKAGGTRRQPIISAPPPEEPMVIAGMGGHWRPSQREHEGKN
ncbi:hypothetical protein U9M48_011278 [Paspalum notatum var. saurae]|uniref:Uncharacterized protein n=1 Tax=Paspalum notatum var. saurae TaxID=547442 RepID=A0AAQ3SVW5_PASNO